MYVSPGQRKGIMIVVGVVVLAVVFLVTRQSTPEAASDNSEQVDRVSTVPSAVESDERGVRSAGNIPALQESDTTAKAFLEQAFTGTWKETPAEWEKRLAPYVYDDELGASLWRLNMYDSRNPTGEEFIRSRTTITAAVTSVKPYKESSTPTERPMYTVSGKVLFTVQKPKMTHEQEFKLIVTTFTAGDSWRVAGVKYPSGSSSAVQGSN